MIWWCARQAHVVTGLQGAAARVSIVIEIPAGGSGHVGLGVAEFCALMLTGLLAGMHVAGPAGLNRALRSLEIGTYLSIKQALDRTMPTLARPLLLSALAAVAALTVVAATADQTVTCVLGAAALLGLLITLVATLRGDLPINREMAAWEADAPPVDWQRTRARWERFFAVRTIAATAAFGCVVIAVLVPG
jgi:uncharacterized membrane protein